MYQTRQMMEKLITPETRQMTLNELAWNYQKKKNPIYFATAFYRVYNLLKQFRYDYEALTEQDFVSIALEKLEQCLTKFDGIGKFSSYFMFCLAKKTNTVSNLCSNKQRKTENYCEDMSLYEIAYTNDNQNLFELTQDLSQLALTVTQKNYLDLLLCGYNKTQIAKILGTCTKYLNSGLNIKTIELKQVLNA